MTWKSAVATVALSGAALLAAATPLLAQAVQTSTLTGTVKDAESGQPIGAAQVAVKGTTRNAIGREDDGLVPGDRGL